MKTGIKYSYIIVSGGVVRTIVNRRQQAESIANGYADAVIYRSFRLHTHGGRVKSKASATAACLSAVNEWSRVQAARARDVLMS